MAPDVTTWNHDAASGRLLQKTDATGRGPTYTWNDAGLMESRTWERGVVTTYGYNSAGDLTATAYSDGTPGMVRTHRRDGSLASVADAAGTTSYSHTGTMVTGENIAGGLLDGLTLSYPTVQGKRQSFTATLGSNTVSAMGYGYDSRGRLDEVSETGIGAGGFSAEFGYAANSDLPVTTVSKAGANTVLTGTRTYDNANRLAAIGYARPGDGVVTSHAYTLDAANRRTKAEREDGTAWTYGYNDRDEVISAVKQLANNHPLAGWQQEFAYDNLGNRKFAREGGDANGANLRQLDYTANALNQYTQIAHPGAFDVLGRAPSDVTVTVNEQPVERQGEFWRKEVGDLPNALAAVWQSVSVDAVDPGAGPGGEDVPARRSGHRFVPMAVEAPHHDADGNLVADARWNYVWDGENRLIEVTTAAPALAAGVPRERYRYGYDSRSRRIARTVERWDLDAGDWVLETSERFVYDEWNVVAVIDAVGEVVQRYAWGNDLSGTPQGAGGVGGLLAAADAASGRSWCYAYDGNGNVSAVVDLADGTKMGRYDYDAFGRTIAAWGDEELGDANGYRFSTKPMEGTGLYYYGYRYYEPETGRWLNRDPIAEKGGTNLYGFVRNNAIQYVDRLGLDAHAFPNPDLPPSSEPVWGNQTGDRPIGDQTDWFDENFKGLVEQAKVKLREKVKLRTQIAVCGSQKPVEWQRLGGEVVLAVVPQNYLDDDARDPSFNSPNSSMVYDDAFGDTPQSKPFAKYVLGKFHFRLSPQRLRLRPGRKGMGQASPGAKFEQGVYYEYTNAKMEIRDNVGGWSGTPTTRGTWSVRGEYFCPCTWKN